MYTILPFNVITEHKGRRMKATFPKGDGFKKLHFQKKNRAYKTEAHSLLLALVKSPSSWSLQKASELFNHDWRKQPDKETWLLPQGLRPRGGHHDEGGHCPLQSLKWVAVGSSRHTVGWAAPHRTGSVCQLGQASVAPQPNPWQA